MPLDSVVGESSVLNRLDLIIVTATRYDSESLSELLDRLVVDRVDLDLSTHEERREKRVFFDDDGSINMLISSLRLKVMEMFIDILFHRTVMGDIEELHPFTDTEDRLLFLENLLHTGQEVSVVERIDTACSVFPVAIQARVDIWSSRKYKCITLIDKIVDMLRICRDDDSDTVGLLDAAYVVEGEIVETASRVMTLLSEDADFFLSH